MRILVGGLARSGTTWFSKVVSSAPGVQYLHEPDTLGRDPLASIGTRGMPFDDLVVPGTVMSSYELMWEVAFAGGWPQTRAVRLALRTAMHRRLPPSIQEASLTKLAGIAMRRRPPTEHLVVKSVRVVMTLEWLADRFRPKTVVVWRSPLNVLASHRALGMEDVAGSVVRRHFEDAAGRPPDDRDGNAFWTICARLGFLLQAASRQPDSFVFRHETLASDPPRMFRDVFDRLGLAYAPEVDRFLETSNEAGSGWVTKRIAREESRRWKDRLTSEQIRTGGEVLGRFAELPVIGAFYAECLAEIE